MFKGGSALDGLDPHAQDMTRLGTSFTVPSTQAAGTSLEWLY
jgi:hypothetical protein